MIRSPMPSDLSPRDRDLMIRTILGEAGNQGPQGQAAVAHVILNRTAAGSYGKSPSDVVLAPSQFEPWTTRSKELMAINPNSAAYQNAGDIVDMAQSGDIPDPTGGATHFLQENIVRQRRGGSLPNWAQQPIAKIQGHTFFAPNGRVGVDPLDAINRALAEPGTP
jgi:spore germination cell wall hydrolase CwlJ-like protein